MKTQSFTQATQINHLNKYLIVIVIGLTTFLSCINWDEIGGGPSTDDHCKQNSSLFSGAYQVSSICDASWGSSDYTITVILDNTYGNCEWRIQNILNTGKDVSGIYESSGSALKIYPQNFVDYWQISGELTRNEDEINIDLRLLSNIMDSTVLCTVTGTQN